MTCTMEWRVCVGFPDYEISEFGDIRRLTPSHCRKVGSRLRGFIDQDGYLHYALRDGEGVKHHHPAHVLVALTFVGPAPSTRHEVAHENGSRVANHFSNLRWSTRLDNHRDMAVHGTGLKGVENGRARISEKRVLAIRREYRAIKNKASALRLRDLDQRYGLTRGQIIRVAKGQAWSHVLMETSQ